MKRMINYGEVIVVTEEVKKKRCPQCKETKILNFDNFYRSSREKSGFRGICKICQDKQNKAYAKKHKDRMVKTVMKSRNSSEERKKNHCRIQEKYRATTKGNRKYLDTLMKNKYGISLEEFESIVEEQGGGCAICSKTAEEQGKRLAIDHCHTTNKVRGVLCSNCNFGIGSLKDNLELLAKAYIYLEDIEIREMTDGDS